MSLIAPTAGEFFTIRIIKSLTTSPLNKWANTYEAVCRVAATSVNLVNLGDALLLFEQALHKNVVRFERIVLSTWEADSVPYNPSNFISEPQSVVGGVGMVGDPVALNQCLSVSRVPAVGRSGHIFYRGVLEEADVTAPAGVTVLSDLAGFQDTVDAAITSSELGTYLSNDDEPFFRLAMITKDGSNERAINSLVVAGVAILPTDHAWFNRT